MLQLSHFRRHKRKTSKKSNGKTTNYPFHKPEENHPPGKDSAKKISNLIGEAAKYAGSTKSKKVRSADNLTNWILTVATIIIYHQLYFLVVMSLPQKLRQALFHTRAFERGSNLSLVYARHFLACVQYVI